MTPLQKEISTIVPFQVRQAIVGVRLNPSDHNLLAYLNFFSQIIPIKAAQWMYVQPDFNFVSFYIEKDLRPLIDQYEVDQQLFEELKNEINREIGDKNPIEMTYQISEGDPLEEIMNRADKIKADLLVIGQKEGESYHSVLAKNLVRKLKSAALIVPDKVRAQLSSILVPIDFSPNAARALQTALGIHRQMKGEVAIKVVYTYRIPSVNLSKIHQTWEEYALMVRRNIYQNLQKFVQSLTPDDPLEVEILLEEQKKLDIAKAILAVADKAHTDLLIMGAKGHSKVARLLLGSVTENVVNKNDHIPILVIK